MKTSHIVGLKLFSLMLVALLLAVHADAATLAPYQQAALKKILATLPSAQREMARPQIEATLAILNKKQVDMMLAGLPGSTPEAVPQAPEPSKGAGQSGEWGKAEADFEKAFGGAQAYTVRMSDLHDERRSACAAGKPTSAA